MQREESWHLSGSLKVGVADQGGRVCTILVLGPCFPCSTLFDNFKKEKIPVDCNRVGLDETTGARKGVLGQIWVEDTSSCEALIGRR